MAVRIVIFNPGDTVYAMAKTGVLRAFTVAANGMIEPADMATALDKEEQVDLRGGAE